MLPCSRGPIQLVGCAEQGGLEKIRSRLSALLLFLLDCLLTSWSVIDSLATTLEGRCGKHRLFLSTQQPLPASWSQHFGSSLRTHPSLSMWSVGLGLQGRLVTGIWPIQRSCLLGPRAQFRAGQGLRTFARTLEKEVLYSPGLWRRKEMYLKLLVATLPP